MTQIEGNIRPYSWGSRTALAELTGRPSPTAHPEAEMWFGAHPGGPSPLRDAEGTLADLIAADPAGQLGEGHDRLPFLLKILAADHALSIQVHPTKAQAEEGFARENAAGIALGDFERNYKDDNHKPELLVALTPFEAMAGFRSVPETKALLEALNFPYMSMVGSGDDAADLRSLLTTLITLPSSVAGPLLEETARACREGELPEEWMRDVARNFVNLTKEYPGDRGALCALLLNYVVLQPGEALYLDAGQLHAYVKGTGVEIMANSDNVLRGGLTTKHMDVPELMRIIRCEVLEDPRLRASESGIYRTPAPEFELQRLGADTQLSAQVSGPAIVLKLGAGVEAQWIGASDPAQRVEIGEGEAAFIARVGRKG